MDDLPFPWYNLHDQDHDQEQTYNFDSEGMFLNSIHQLSPTDWADQPVEAANLVCNNGFQENNNVISTVVTAATTTASSQECIFSGTNSSTNASDGIPVTLTADCKSLRRNNVSGVSSGDHSATDEGVVSQSLQQINQFECSSGKRAKSGAGVSDDPPNPKRSRSNTGRPTSSNINFQQPDNPSETDVEAIAQMKEMIYREAAFRPVSFVTDTVVEKPKRRNVRISSDPQTVAARERRERISERIRVLQKLVPGGNKMDTASMLDEAANYLKFLRSQVKALEQLGLNSTTINASGTSQILPHASVVVPFTQNPFFMQTHFSFPYENLYPNPPPACIRKY